MGGPLGFGAPKEMDIGFEGREDDEGGSAEGMTTLSNAACGREMFLKVKVQ